MKYFLAIRILIRIFVSDLIITSIKNKKTMKRFTHIEFSKECSKWNASIDMGISYRPIKAILM